MQVPSFLRGSEPFLFVTMYQGCTSSTETLRKRIITECFDNRRPILLQDGILCIGTFLVHRKYLDKLPYSLTNSRNWYLERVRDKQDVPFLGLDNREIAECFGGVCNIFRIYFIYHGDIYMPYLISNQCRWYMLRYRL